MTMIMTANRCTSTLLPSPSTIHICPRSRTRRFSTTSTVLLLSLLLLIGGGGNGNGVSKANAIKWPRLPSAKTQLSSSKQQQQQTSSNKQNLNGKSSSSEEQHQNLEPLLQVPCSLQLVPNTGDSGMGRPKRAVRTFCDTGAQRTCISWKAVQQLGWGHLMDSRYEGQATGVGLCRVLGRIPAQTVLLHFGGSGQGGVTIMAPAITVLESTGMDQGVDLLLGLDFFRETRAVLDLNQDSLQLLVRMTHDDSNNSPKHKAQPPKMVKIPFVRSDNDGRSSTRLPKFSSNANENAKAQNYAKAKAFIAKETPQYWEEQDNGSENDSDNDDSDGDSDPYYSSGGKMDMRGL